MDILTGIVNQAQTVANDQHTFMFVDAGYANSLPDLVNAANLFIHVHSFPSVSLEKTIHDQLKISSVIYFISSVLDNDIATSIINHQQHYFHSHLKKDSIPITIFTSITQDYYKFKEDTVKSPFQIIKDWFLPVQVSYIYHLPLHVQKLLGPSDPVQLFRLSSPHCATMFPSIHSSQFTDEDLFDTHPKSNANSPQASKQSHSQSMFPSSSPLASQSSRTKTGIHGNDKKYLAHEIISALIFNYGLDPSKHVYSLGQTSNEVGKVIQSMVNDMKELRGLVHPSNLSLLSMTNPLDSSSSSSSNHTKNAPTLTPATLLIIDRTEDLFTPSIHGAQLTPLAHRILSTITTKSSSSNGFDIQLPSNTIYRQDQFLSQSDYVNRNILDSPFSALSSLPIQLPPSLLQQSLYVRNQSISIRKLISSIFTESEDTSRNVLTTILKDAIEAEHGTVPAPSKKRGFGAEILMYVQALIVSPGSSTGFPISSLGYNPIICIKYESILSISLAVIETMQRSSNKQFASVCNWKLSYDTMSSKDDEIIQSLQKLIASHSNLSIMNDGEYLQHRLVYTEMMKQIIKLCDQGTANNVKASIDICYVLLQLIRYVSLIGNEPNHESQDSISINSLASSLRDYIISSSPKDELMLLVSYHIVGQEIMSDIIALREMISLSKIVQDVKQTKDEKKVKEEEKKKVVDDDEWDDFGSDDDDTGDINGNNQQDNELMDDMTSLRQRLELELLDTLYVYIDNIVTKIGSTRTKSLTKKTTSLELYDECDIFSSYMHSYHVSTSSCHSVDSQDIGVIARSCYSIVKHRQSLTTSSSSVYTMTNYQHIESSLAILKRAGLGLLSSGLGRLGLGTSSTSTPHPSDNMNVVVFVIGGISFEEISQVNKVIKSLSSSDANHGIQFIVGSNNIFTPDDIFQYL